MKIFIIHGWTYTTNKWQPLVADLQSKGFEPVLLSAGVQVGHRSKPDSIRDEHPVVRGGRGLARISATRLADRVGRGLQ